MPDADISLNCFSQPGVVDGDEGAECVRAVGSRRKQPAAAAPHRGAHRRLAAHGHAAVGVRKTATCRSVLEWQKAPRVCKKHTHLSLNRLSTFKKLQHMGSHNNVGREAVCLNFSCLTELLVNRTAKNKKLHLCSHRLPGHVRSGAGRLGQSEPHRAAGRHRAARQAAEVPENRAARAPHRRQDAGRPLRRCVPFDDINNVLCSFGVSETQPKVRFFSRCQVWRWCCSVLFLRTAFGAVRLMLQRYRCSCLSFLPDIFSYSTCFHF